LLIFKENWLARFGICSCVKLACSACCVLNVGCEFCVNTWHFEFAHRSRIVGVNNHQIRFISTHRKIRHSASTKWYSFPGWSVSLLSVFFLQITQYIGGTHNTRTIIPMNTRIQTIPLCASSKTVPANPQKLFPIVHETKQNCSRLDRCPSNLFSLALPFDNLVCWVCVLIQSLLVSHVLALFFFPPSEP
jgi:hypothetical protein